MPRPTGVRYLLFVCLTVLTLAAVGCASGGNGSVPNAAPTPIPADATYWRPEAISLDETRLVIRYFFGDRACSSFDKIDVD
jgi:hypothetical protein